MKEVKIQVLIPTYNNVLEISNTLNSIREQTFDKESIYVTVVDFGSTDGTLDVLFSYDYYHLGIYQKDEQKNARLRVAEASQLLEHINCGGKYNLYVLLYPGDIMYPECLHKCVAAFINQYNLNPVSVICESDIIQMDGTTIKQKSLYKEDRVIDGSTAFNDYVMREYKHQIFEVVISFNHGRYKANGEINEKRFWNKAARNGLGKNIIYLKESLICTRQIFYEDEFEEVLHRWESLISLPRVYTNKFGNIFNDEYEKLAGYNLAEYALWRSWILYKDKERRKEMEDCFLIASVICLHIECSEIYQLLKNLIFNNDISVIDKINNYFSY